MKLKKYKLRRIIIECSDDNKIYSKIFGIFSDFSRNNWHKYYKLVKQSIKELGGIA